MVQGNNLWGVRHGNSWFCRRMPPHLHEEALAEYLSCWEHFIAGLVDVMAE